MTVHQHSGHLSVWVAGRAAELSFIPTHLDLSQLRSGWPHTWDAQSTSMEVNLWTLQFARACVVLSHGEFFPLTSREAKTPKQGFDRKKKKTRFKHVSCHACSRSRSVKWVYFLPEHWFPPFSRSLYLGVGLIPWWSCNTVVVLLWPFALVCYGCHSGIPHTAWLK